MQNRFCVKEMYENYIFDLYGTLVDIRTNENKPYLWQKMSEIYSALGADYTAKELKAAFRELEQEIVAELPVYGEPELGKVFAGLFQKKGVDCNSQLIKNTAIVFRTISRQKLKTYEGVIDTLNNLRKNGKGVYLLSNAQSDFTRPELDMLGLTPCFDGILISSEEGYKKPSPIFYHRLLEKFELHAANCLMVGNDESSDIAGAIAVGMNSLYIHTEISPQEPVKKLATFNVLDGDWEKVSKILKSTM